jgi:hypothetical protein
MLVGMSRPSLDVHRAEGIHLRSMGDAVIAAVVAGVVSLLVAFGKIAWDSRQMKWERRLAARERLEVGKLYC